jgi:D-amino-acid oxidase
MHAFRWEWPPAVCGQHRNVASLEKSKRWCMTAYRAFDELMQILPAEEHGVRMRTANFFFSKQLEDMPGQLLKMNEVKSISDVGSFG